MTTTVPERVGAADRNPFSVPPHVAILDDDPRIRALLEDALFDFGIRASLCARAADLFALLGRRRCDLILVDVTVPDLNGIACLQRLMQNPRAGQVLMVTAIEDEALRRACLQAGALECILKTDLFERLPQLMTAYLQQPPLDG